MANGNATNFGGNVPPYGQAIQQAIAGGELKEMKRVAKQAERFLAEHSDVRSALEVLRIEIHRLESKKAK